MNILYRQQFIQPKNDQTGFLETEMKIQTCSVTILPDCKTDRDL